MREGIAKVGVIGGGVMGSGIAAHIAGAGIEVLLLDIVPPDLKPEEKKDKAARNRFADNGVQNALKARPAAFFDPDDARLIATGNLEDDFDQLKGCDWIIEVVIEKMDIKQKLFERLEGVRKPETVVSSNTSGLSLAEMCKGRSAEFKRHFMVTHFFNPVRYMKLLELVAGKETDPAVVARIARFGERVLGKGIVYGKDTPNFVANRIGVYSMMQGIHDMDGAGLTIEQVDKIFGPAMGRPDSAAFRTADIVGLDTLMHVSLTCYNELPKDECRDTFKVPQKLQLMIEKKLLGQKTKGGFYKKIGDDIQVYDFGTANYRPKKEVKYKSLGAAKSIDDPGKRIATVVGGDDDAAKFAWKGLASMLVYAANRVGEIADDVVNIDRAMRWGFNWDLGPFQTWDAVGVRASVERMKKDGYKVPAAIDEMLAAKVESFYGGTPMKPTYYDFKQKKHVPMPADERALSLKAFSAEPKAVIKKNPGATLWDIGDGCLALAFHTKMNTVDGDVMAMMDAAVTEAETNHRALVIYNEDPKAFSAGAQLMLIYMLIQAKKWSEVELAVTTFQKANMRLKYSTVPVIVAPHQLTLGGGCEITLHASQVVAAAETYIGLVEVGVGLIPAGGGTKELALRCINAIPPDVEVDPLRFAGLAFQNIATARVATGAFEAKRFGLLRPSDWIVLNRDHQLKTAKQLALGMAAAGYNPPKPQSTKALGPDTAATFANLAWSMMEGGYASAHDLLIAKKVAHILAGGTRAPGSVVTEQDLLDLEREAFMSLCGEEKSQARMQYLLMNNKPLRN